jgi:hypothetical protein
VRQDPSLSDTALDLDTTIGWRVTRTHDTPSFLELRKAEVLRRPPSTPVNGITSPLCGRIARKPVTFGRRSPAKMVSTRAPNRRKEAPDIEDTHEDRHGGGVGALRARCGGARRHLARAGRQRYGPADPGGHDAPFRRALAPAEAVVERLHRGAPQREAGPARRTRRSRVPAPLRSAELLRILLLRTRVHRAKWKG